MKKYLKSQKLGIIVLIFSIFIIFAGMILYFLLHKDTTPIQTVVTETKNEIEEVENKKIYFGKESIISSTGDSNKYILVDVQTGAITNFLPKGYSIINSYDYQTFAPFIILQKDNNIYLYDVSDKFIKTIKINSTDLKIEEDEQIEVYPSITENNKFIINIKKLYTPKDDNIKEHDEYGYSDDYGIRPIVVGSRAYYFDALKNELSIRPGLKSEGCSSYDSKNQRLFKWTCAEGAPSVAPLYIADLNGNIKEQVIFAKDFGILENDLDLIKVKYRDGLFFISAYRYYKDKNNKIIVIDPTDINISKEIYMINSNFTPQISDDYTHSIGIDKTTNTLVIVSDSQVSLMRFDENKKIIQSSIIKEDELYAFFISIYNGKLYYQSPNSVRIVNLVNWVVEKSIPSLSEGSMHNNLFVF